jgi:uncharacterized protein (DUF58 family)
MLVGLLLAAWNNQIIIAIIIGLVLSVAGLTRLWSRLSVIGVSCERLLTEQRTFKGESLEFKLRLVNRKLLPLPWVQVDDELPVGFISGLSAEIITRPGFGLLTRNTSLLWYTAISWRCKLDCDKRGYYRLGPIKITTGDIFGFYPRSVVESSSDYIIVYPLIYPIEKLGIPSLYPLGETQAERRIFEDPSRLLGLRGYSPGDSLRRIHWKATARHQNLQVKIFEPTTTHKVILFLAVDSFKQDEDKGEEEFELGISTAASVASYLIDQSNPVGIFINTRLADSNQSIKIPPGTGMTQLVYILESLAKTTHNSSIKFDKFIQDERRNLPYGITLIFVVAEPPAYLDGLLIDLKENGYKIVILQVNSNMQDSTYHDFAWHHIHRPGHLRQIISGKAK